MLRRTSVTIKDIARASGVSYPTVSYVLNNTRPVSEATRRRVLEAVERLNYRPNALARGLQRKRMNTLGVVLPYSQQFIISDTYIGPILEGIVAVAQQRDQAVLIFNSRRHDGSVEEVSLYGDGRSDGLLLIHEPTDGVLVRRLRASDIPICCINEVRDESVPSVDAAQEEGARELLEHLIGLGHRRIVFLEGPCTVASSQRAAGYRKALEAHGLIPVPSVPGYYTQESGFERALALLTLSPGERPTALCCCNDRIALGAIEAARTLGLRVPDDLSVVGFDDIPEAQHSDPPLTTMQLPFRELGVRAAMLLLEQIGGDATPEAAVRLPMLLQRRASTAPPR